ncbi:hypothetical protein JRO89_XS11G0033500 [Xanthoceras sorbifolium]|uniref:RRM domain-containing protein n=1 Tax=Xanthoceras sorbifolium TaxID=99658 RepID=A0ABQ8HEI4_9ROSI|nr:hypothetical protein JRO89_XS11G0033500 [Xanthoceras sorbifolium]
MYGSRGFSGGFVFDGQCFGWVGVGEGRVRTGTPSRAKRSNDKDQMEYSESLKMRGLLFSVKKSEIVEFFKDYKLIGYRVHIACRPDGKATGEAYVEFTYTEEQCARTR